MPNAIVLADNIYDETRAKRLQGDEFECSKEFADIIAEQDKDAGRKPRIKVLKGSSK